MKAIFSNYNFTPTWIKDYDFDYLIYDRSDNKDYLKDFPQDRIVYVENKGTDLYDKFSWIIDNYDNLPEIALYSKANLFKYISREEFEKVKDNKTFTPLLTQNHKTYLPVCYYQDGLYYEINDYWYLNSHPAKNAREIIDIFKMGERYYNAFAPGSNYIIPKENILKHPKELYEKLRSFLEWDVYPGDAQILERNLYYLWNTPQSPNQN